MISNDMISQFFFLEKLFIMIFFGSENSRLKARLGFIRNFLTCSFHTSKHKSLKNKHLKKVKSPIGDQKSAQKVSRII